MPLRNSLVSKIWTAIEKSPFTAADFDVVFGDKDESLLLITFRHEPGFRFAVSQNYTGAVAILASPGDHKTHEVIAVDGFSEIPEKVTAWARNVRDELRATIPIYSELDELREILDRHVADHIDNPGAPFSESEIVELRGKLDELMARFQEMQEKNEMTEQELNRLNQEITSIKTNLTTYPKGVWYKTAANKIWASVSKVATSQESRQVIAQAARKLLGLDPSS